MHIKDIISSKFIFLSLHMLSLFISVYSRADNIWTGLKFTDQSNDTLVNSADNR